jgi:hypothetical protein
MADSIDFRLQDFGGGYRPTATGVIFSHPFVFRMMDSRWAFVVGKENATDLWWHSPETERTFTLEGSCDGPLWQDDAAPILVQALDAYCLSIGAAANRDAVLALAKAAIRSFKANSQ